MSARGRRRLRNQSAPRRAPKAAAKTIPVRNVAVVINATSVARVVRGLWFVVRRRVTEIFREINPCDWAS